jgi:hypothetical protein
VWGVVGGGRGGGPAGAAAGGAGTRAVRLQGEARYEHPVLLCVVRLLLLAVMLVMVVVMVVMLLLLLLLRDALQRRLQQVCKAGDLGWAQGPCCCDSLCWWQRGSQQGSI